VITSPLGFFALALLIVEGFLGISMFADIGSDAKFWGMCIGAALFVFVVLGVMVLVWCKPTHLTFSEKSHLQAQLQELQRQRAWGTSDQPVTKSTIEGEPRSEAPANV
jgi:hypothetical protein